MRMGAFRVLTPEKNQLVREFRRAFSGVLEACFLLIDSSETIDAMKGAFMIKVKKILAPTDLSEHSRIGVRYALETGAAAGAEVIVYHVVAFPAAAPCKGHEFGYTTQGLPAADDVVDRHRRELAEFLRKNFSDILAGSKVREEVSIGTPSHKIVEKAEAENADLIVMSTHGRTGVGRALIGSVAEKVVRTAPCAVLAVRPKRSAMRTDAAA